MTEVLAVIPARWASSRFPGKPLADLLGKPMIQRVVEQVRRASRIDEVLVATDDPRILEAVQGFGGQAMLTRPDHRTGTDRMAEVAERHPARLYVNVQGDEPLIDPRGLDALVDWMQTHDPGADVGTLCFPISAREAGDPNRVKVVRTASGRALYFSRSPIPFPRDERAARYFQHVGVYAFRAEVLRAFPTLSSPELERAESLEQLRLMHAGYTIQVLEAGRAAPGVDTPEDLERVARILRGEQDEARPPIALLLTDVDGVWTDGGLYYGPEGEALKRFDVRDGLGVKRLMRAGVRVVVISGRDSPALRRRLQDLGVDEAYLGIERKGEVAREILASSGLSASQVAALGDDLVDLELFALSGLKLAPADAVPEVRRAADEVLSSPGGRGAVREAAERILRDLRET